MGVVENVMADFCIDLVGWVLVDTHMCYNSVTVYTIVSFLAVCFSLSHSESHPQDARRVYLVWDKDQC